MTEWTEQTPWPWIETAERKPDIGVVVLGNGREPALWNGQHWQSATTFEPTEIARWQPLDDTTEPNRQL